MLFRISRLPSQPSWQGVFAFVIVAVGASQCVQADERPRARDLGIVIGRFSPGQYNAITDVQGVRVGHETLIKGEGSLRPGKGPMRTGVTVIIPRDDIWNQRLPAGGFILNGNGEATGFMWLAESGMLETPIALTNTLAVPVVQQALVTWLLQSSAASGQPSDAWTALVLECDDSYLNDIRGRHVKAHHVFEALRRASNGPVAEGSVGAGTGMIAYDFKGGIGTASRIVPIGSRSYTVGVLVLANAGDRRSFRIKGLPVGEQIPDLMPAPLPSPSGSIIILIATNTPLDAHQLPRLAKRAMLGLARTGTISHHESGDLAIAFSTATAIPRSEAQPILAVETLHEFYLDELYEAAVDATEEAILNAMLAADTMTGRDGHTVYALPVDRLRALLRR